jgi:hypothetical protein
MHHFRIADPRRCAILNAVSRRLGRNALLKVRTALRFPTPPAASPLFLILDRYAAPDAGLAPIRNLSSGAKSCCSDKECAATSLEIEQIF